jgi:hypothetical protein
MRILNLLEKKEKQVTGTLGLLWPTRANQGWLAGPCLNRPLSTAAARRSARPGQGHQRWRLGAAPTVRGRMEVLTVVSRSTAMEVWMKHAGDRRVELRDGRRDCFDECYSVRR